LTVGQTLEEALLRHETVEQLACILAQARQLGPVNRIPRGDLVRLSAIRKDHDGS
jgi:ribulose-5-phosphate 4-epimerase/fuculose-1-phosphate aldolase